MDVQIEASWQQALAGEFEKPYYKDLTKRVADAYRRTTVYPPQKLVLAAFNYCPLPQVKVVILGQDPYHGPGQAHGLAFSVPPNVTIPHSLRNIYKEVQADIGTLVYGTGDLTPWAQQGVLLLNSTLTVEAGLPGSHQHYGSQMLTDEIIATISREREGVVFLLWGAFANKKSYLIDATRHLVLTASHPSPLSAHRGFIGCRHFSKTNSYLNYNKLKAINW